MTLRLTIFLTVLSLLSAGLAVAAGSSGPRTHPLRRCGNIEVTGASYEVEIWDRYGTRLPLSCPDATRVATWYFRRASHIRSWPNPGHNLDWLYNGRDEGCYHARPYTESAGYTCDISLPHTATEQDLLIGVDPVRTA